MQNVWETLQEPSPFHFQKLRITGNLGEKEFRSAPCPSESPWPGEIPPLMDAA